jgi:hypothetical protein
MAENVLTPERAYAETCAIHSRTDEISFKLLGIVPVLSGATMLTFFLKEQLAEKVSLVITLSLFAALITLRNIQTCSWLRRRAEALERSVVEVGCRRVLAIRLAVREGKKRICGGGYYSSSGSSRRREYFQVLSAGCHA